ncbi:MAG: hypothetical protein KJN63_03240, partial [Acidimicrobiia bacterium]|nr:hypothetical protein [Acidimicrobiia bacterium]
MDSQELNRACELAFLVAREGVEQDPPIDPPASMRMFLYVRQYPQRALTVARQVLADEPEFRNRVAAAATIENVGEAGLAWLQGDGSLPGPVDDGTFDYGNVDDGTTDSGTVDDGGVEDGELDGSDDPDASAQDQGQSSDTPATEADRDAHQPVTKETIRSEMDELKNLVGQLSQERAAVDSEVEELANRLKESEQTSGLGSALSEAVASDSVVRGSASLTAQIRGLHADLKQARSDRDHAQEAKELAILEHAELAEELENLRNLASSAQVQLAELESKVRDVSTEKDQLASEKDQLSAERQALANDKDSLSAEVSTAEARLADSEAKLTNATADLESLTAELEELRSSTGASVHELQAAVAARAAMEGHVEALGGAHAKARAEMERVDTALVDKNTSDAQKIETLKVALASVTSERDALQTKLDVVRATVSSLQGEMVKLESNFGDAESVASVLSERMDELQSSVDALPAQSTIEVDLDAFDTPEMPPLAASPAPVIDSPDAGDSAEETPLEELQAEPVTDEGETNELIPEEILAPGTVDAAEYRDPEVMEPESEMSPLVISDTADGVSAGPADEAPDEETEAPAEAQAIEDIDEVHDLVAQTVASFEPSDTDDLPGSGVSASDAADAGVSADRRGLTSLFTSFIPGGSKRTKSESEQDAVEESDAGPESLAAAAVGPGGLASGQLMSKDDVEASTENAGSLLFDTSTETEINDDRSIAAGSATVSGRGPIV